MEETKQDAQEVHETPESENVDSSNNEQVEPEAPEQEEGETKEEYSQREKEYYARIKKLEKELKDAKSQPKTVTVEGLSQNDLLFIAKADIHEDDVEDVTRWAKNDGISVKDAYANYKPLLDNRAQERKTAETTATKSPRGTKAQSGADLLEKARTGDFKPTQENIREVVKARIEARRNKR